MLFPQLNDEELHDAIESLIWTIVNMASADTVLGLQVRQHYAAMLLEAESERSRRRERADA